MTWTTKAPTHADLDAFVDAELSAAREAPPKQALQKLWSLQERAPDSLDVYYYLYKLHATRRELADAERAARLGLERAARLTGLPRAVLASGEPLPPGTSLADGPGRFWLFTLKALAFIRLRQGDLTTARDLLAQIQLYDPSQGVGSDVSVEGVGLR